MKKIATTIMICLFGLGTAIAQETDPFDKDVKKEKKWSFGIKGGMQYNQYRGSGLEDGSSGAASFHIGGLVEYKLSEKFSLQSEAVLMQNGNFFENVKMNNTLSVSTDGEWTVNYLNIPLLAKYYVKKRWSIEAGPQIGIRLGSSGKIERLFEDGTMTTQNVYGHIVKGLNVGMSLGTTYEFSNGIFASARYTRGISNEKILGSNLKLKNENFQFSVGYKF